MTETEFLKLNDELHERRAAIRKARKQSEPVHISKVLPEVMDSIQHRRGTTA